MKPSDHSGAPASLGPLLLRVLIVAGGVFVILLFSAAEVYILGKIKASSAVTAITVTGTWAWALYASGRLATTQLHRVVLGLVIAATAFLFLLLLSAAEISGLNLLKTPAFITTTVVVGTWVFALYVGLTRAGLVQNKNIEFGDFVTLGSIVAAVFMAFATLQEQQRFEQFKEERDTPQFQIDVKPLPGKEVEDFEGYRVFSDPGKLGLATRALLLTFRNDSETAPGKNVKIRVQVGVLAPNSIYGFACFGCEASQCSHGTERTAVAGIIPTELLLTCDGLERLARLEVVLGVASERSDTPVSIAAAIGSENKGRAIRRLMLP